MAKEISTYAAEQMADGRYVVTEYGDPDHVVLSGLTKEQAEKLVAYLVKQLDDWEEVRKLLRGEGRTDS
jgi:hypothetical protein